MDNPSADADAGFYVMANGQVESCQIQGAEHLYSRYAFAYGPDWTYSHGVEHGMSQIAVNTSGPDSVFVWNYPIDCTFHSTNVHGWPQLVFSVWGVNWMGGDVIKGYGSTFLPTTPGRHTRYVRLYAPVSSSLCQRFTAWMSCAPPEFFETKFIAQGKGREVTRVQSNGVIKIVINITTKNMSDWGYHASGERAEAAPANPIGEGMLMQGPDDPRAFPRRTSQFRSGDGGRSRDGDRDPGRLASSRRSGSSNTRGGVGSGMGRGTGRKSSVDRDDRLKEAFLKAGVTGSSKRRGYGDDDETDDRSPPSSVRGGRAHSSGAKASLGLRARTHTARGGGRSRTPSPEPPTLRVGSSGSGRLGARTVLGAAGGVGEYKREERRSDSSSLLRGGVSASARASGGRKRYSDDDSDTEDSRRRGKGGGRTGGLAPLRR